MRRQALLDVFEDKADAMDAKRREAKRQAKIKQKRESAKEAEEFERSLKKAKKETARKKEFRTQHKSHK
jgi:ribosome biogenesis protein BMS1